jgi:hypothetical protein
VLAIADCINLLCRCCFCFAAAAAEEQKQEFVNSNPHTATRNAFKYDPATRQVRLLLAVLPLLLRRLLLLLLLLPERYPQLAIA